MPECDDLIRRLNPTPGDLARGQKPVVLDSLMAGIVAQIENSRSLIDAVYGLEDRLPSAGDGAWTPVPGVAAFGLERAREAAKFTASLYFTAWRLSEGLKFEDWVDRAGETAAE